MLDNCIFCGTDIEEGFCYECDETAAELGLAYEDLVELL